jgi:hypothetical protein
MRRTVLVLFLLAGCAGTDGGRAAAPVPSGTPEVHGAWSSCDAVGAPIPDEAPKAATLLPRLAADFEPTAVVVCRRTPQQRADGGTDLMDVEGRATDPAGVAAVVRAVRMPNEAREAGDDTACRSDLPSVPWFALLDAAGRWVRPGVPVDNCDRIRDEMVAAVEKLTLVQVSARPVRELESSAAAASGCRQDWADMVWVTGQFPDRKPPPAARVDPLAAAPQVRACVYRVPESERGGGKPAGQFERGGILPMERRAVLTAAIKGTVAAPACTTPAGRFAVVASSDGAGGSVYVELDGCRRILVEPLEGGGWLGTADAALVAVLASV